LIRKGPEVKPRNFFQVLGEEKGGGGAGGGCWGGGGGDSHAGEGVKMGGVLGGNKNCTQRKVLNFGGNTGKEHIESFD